MKIHQKIIHQNEDSSNPEYRNNQKIERSKRSNDKIAAGIIAAGIPLLETKKEKLHEIQFCIFTAVKNVLQTCKRREKRRPNLT
jgi:hypothetical protein